MKTELKTELKSKEIQVFGREVVAEFEELDDALDALAALAPKRGPTRGEWFAALARKRERCDRTVGWLVMARNRPAIALDDVDDLDMRPTIALQAGQR